MKRWFTVLLALCTLLSFASAGMAEADPYAVTEPITIEFWHALSNNELLNQLIDEFEKQNPLITVNPIYQGSWTDINTKLSAAISGNNADLLPAVVTLNPAYVGTFVEGGMVECLEDYVKADGYKVEEFSRGMIETFQWDDTLYGLPYLNSCLVIYYNADMAQAEGLELPTDWAGMEEFVAKATNDQHKAIGVHCGGAWYYECFFTNILPVFGTDHEPTCLLDDPRCLSVAEDMQRWYAEGKLDWLYGSSAAADGRGAFTSGKYFAYVQSSATYQTLQKQSDFTVGMAFPFGNERGRYSHVGGQGIALTAGASQAQKNAGWQLIKYLTNEDCNLALAEVTGYLPTRSTTISSEKGQAYLAKYPAFLPIIEMLDYIEKQPRFNNSTNCNTIWMSELSRAIIEGGDMKAAMLDVTEQIIEIIEEN